MSEHQTEIGVLDVAIVGAGVSGAYCGWRLLATASGPPPRIALFEAADRIGGRLLSLQPPGIPNTRVELGGMRYTPAHVRVAGLLRELGIRSTPFPVGEPENLRYLRGCSLRVQDITDASKLPYDLLPDESTPQALENGFTALAAQRMLRMVLHKDVDLEKVDWDALARTGRYEGRLLRDLPLRYILQRGISQEAVKFANDSSGYDTILTVWNAADGFPWNLGDFGREVTYFHAEPGYDSLPRTLAQKFEGLGGKVTLGRRLAGFDEVDADGGKAIEMRFADGGSVTTRRLILAMPRRSLELLDQTGAVLAPENRAVHELIASVTPMPLFKLAMCYRFPWWQTIDPVAVDANGKKEWRRLMRGQSITDLPVRQCYYWAVDAETQNAVVLIYDDGSDLDFWTGLREAHAGVAFVNSLRSDDSDGSAEWRQHNAPQLMVEEAHRQLLIMHGVSNRPDIPMPYAAAYRDWGEDPFGGGANYWHLHVDSRTVARAILQPKPPIKVHVCGEAYSHNQGWVEGALETADQLLQLHFNLPPPPWIGS
jgi:Flavin containing amine oxidoreductase